MVDEVAVNVEGVTGVVKVVVNEAKVLKVVEGVNGVAKEVVNEVKVSKVVKEANGVGMVNVEGVADAAVGEVVGPLRFLKTDPLLTDPCSGHHHRDAPATPV